MIPILYSFRRCPYAIRARMALHYAAVAVEHREILLSDKPRTMLQASPKGTVPVLVLPNGQVIDESADVMRWALTQNDPDRWWQDELEQASNGLVAENDHVFKKHLDRYKYADRYPEHPPAYYRAAAEQFLRVLEEMLGPRPYLVDQRMRFADVAVFPFIRQFSLVDTAWFAQAPYPRVRAWLQTFLDSGLFRAVMRKTPLWREEPSND